ncbi:MAG: hypothetical protein OEY29_11830, partial [Gammaproteobacteria bacterium]|nr:hypothetical protein [Gammaproteobacteria bacterium]
RSAENAHGHKPHEHKHQGQKVQAKKAPSRKRPGQKTESKKSMATTGRRGKAQPDQSGDKSMSAKKPFGAKKRTNRHSADKK